MCYSFIHLRCVYDDGHVHDHIHMDNKFHACNLLVSSQMKPELLHGAVYNATGCTKNTTTRQHVYNNCPLIITLNSRIFVVAVGS